MTDGPNLLKLTATLAIDYLRWTQLAPLITIWAFGLAMLAAMLFITFEEQSWDALGSLLEWIAGLEPFNGPAGNWMLTFGGLALVLFLVNAWCLSIAHALGLARRAVDESSFGAGQSSKPLSVSERS